MAEQLPLKQLVAGSSPAGGIKNSDKEVRMFLYKFLYNFLYVLFRPQILEIKGLENLPKDQGFIIAANHSGVYDPFVIAVALKKFLWQHFTPFGKKLYFLGNARLRNKVFRYHFISFGLIVLGAKIGYLQASRVGLNEAIPLLRDGNIVVIFPEGHQNPLNTLLRGRKGVGVLALFSGVPVLPTGCFGSIRVKKVRQFFKGWKKKKRVIFGNGFSFVEETQEEINRNPQNLGLTTDFIMEKISQLCGKKYLQ